MASKALVHPTEKCRICGYPLTTPRVSSEDDKRLHWGVIYLCYPCIHGLLVRAGWTDGNVHESRNGDHRGKRVREVGHFRRVWAAPEMQKRPPAEVA